MECPYLVFSIATYIVIQHVIGLKQNHITYQFVQLEVFRVYAFFIINYRKQCVYRWTVCYVRGFVRQFVMAIHFRWQFIFIHADSDPNNRKWAFGNSVGRVKIVVNDKWNNRKGLKNVLCPTHNVKDNQKNYWSGI